MYSGWSLIKYIPKFENIHLFHEWKYHFTADLLFYLFGFSSFAYAKLTCKVRSYPLKKEFSCSVILPLMKWMSVFCLGISFLDHKVAWLLYVYLNFTNLWDLCNWFLKACTQIKLSHILTREISQSLQMVVRPQKTFYCNCTFPFPWDDHLHQK